MTRRVETRMARPQDRKGCSPRKAIQEKPLCCVGATMKLTTGSKTTVGNEGETFPSRRDCYECTSNARQKDTSADAGRESDPASDPHRRKARYRRPAQGRLKAEPRAGAGHRSAPRVTLSTATRPCQLRRLRRG